MFQIGFTEMFLLFAGVLALVLGPERIVELGKRALQAMPEANANAVAGARASVNRRSWERPHDHRTDEVSIVPLAALFGAGLVVLLVAAFWALHGV